MIRQRRDGGKWEANEFNDPTIDGKVMQNTPEGKRTNVRGSFMPSIVRREAIKCEVYGIGKGCGKIKQERIMS
jgi:hypothetical protein